MLFTRSKIFMACAMSTTLLLGACSNDKNNQGNTKTLTATAPATGEASNLSERNAQQRLIKTLQQHFKKANINAKVVDVKATEVPNLYWVSLEGMPSVYATSDGKYLIQGDVIRLGDKELHSVSENLQSVENKRYLQELKTEDLIVYPAKNKTQHIIYVFTDVSCPYCQKLHAHMDEITAKGTLAYMVLTSLTADVPLTPGNNKSKTNNSGSPFLMMAACNSLNLSNSMTLEAGRMRRNNMPIACRTKGWSSMMYILIFITPESVLVV